MVLSEIPGTLIKVRISTNVFKKFGSTVDQIYILNCLNWRFFLITAPYWDARGLLMYPWSNMYMLDISTPNLIGIQLFCSPYGEKEWRRRDYSLAPVLKNGPWELENMVYGMLYYGEFWDSPNACIICACCSVVVKMAARGNFFGPASYCYMTHILWKPMV